MQTMRRLPQRLCMQTLRGLRADLAKWPASAAVHALTMGLWTSHQACLQTSRGLGFPMKRGRVGFLAGL
jgi:hypothetical protein